MGTLDEFAPFGPSADQLFTHALGQIRDSKHLLDVLHVMLAFVRNPWSMRDVRDSPAIALLLSNSGAMLELGGALRAYLQPTAPLPPQRSGFSGPLFDVETYQGGVTPALHESLRTARDHGGSQPLSDTIILWSILNGQNSASAAVRSLEDDHPGISCDEIIQELDMRARREQSLLGTTDQFSTNRQHWMPRRLAPHFSYQHALRHRDLMRDITDDLSRCEEGQFVLVSGLNGSPLHYVPHILADALGDVATASSLPFQNHYAGVWVANMANYLLWANSSIVPNSDRLLLEGIESVAIQNGILVLEHVEILAAQEPAEQHLRSLLQTPIAGSAIVALYEEESLSDSGAALTSLGLNNTQARSLIIDPYTPAHALNSLKENFVPEWAKQGFIFKGDVTDRGSGPFHDLLELVGGAEFEGARMSLPYLLVEVTQDVFKCDARAIHTCASTARNRIASLLGPGPHNVPEEVIQYYHLPLVRALQEIQQVEQNPDFERRDDCAVITSAHLTAVFLGSHRSRFRYPNAIPRNYDDTTPTDDDVRPPSGGRRR